MLSSRVDKTCQLYHNLLLYCIIDGDEVLPTNQRSLSNPLGVIFLEKGVIMSEYPLSRAERAVEDSTLKEQIAIAWMACRSLRCSLPFTSARTACPHNFELTPNIPPHDPLPASVAKNNVRRILPIIESCQIGHGHRPTVDGESNADRREI